MKQSERWATYSPTRKALSIMLIVFLGVGTMAVVDKAQAMEICTRENPCPAPETMVRKFKHGKLGTSDAVNFPHWFKRKAKRAYTRKYLDASAAPVVAAFATAAGEMPPARIWWRRWSSAQNCVVGSEPMEGIDNCGFSGNDRVSAGEVGKAIVTCGATAVVMGAAGAVTGPGAIVVGGVGAWGCMWAYTFDWIGL
jgi:hypothetical protein